MDCGRWISRFAFAGLSILGASGNYGIGAENCCGFQHCRCAVINRAPLCFTARIAVACRDWESGHAYNPGDQIMPKIANPSLEPSKLGRRQSDPSEPRWASDGRHYRTRRANTTGVPGLQSSA